MFKEAFQNLRKYYSIEEPDVVVYNVHDAVFGDLASIDAQAFTSCWQRAALGLFHVAKEVTPGMVKSGPGVIGITGATASWRGMPQTAAFAPAKAAQRALAQSMARDLGPKGIHVYLLVVDGPMSDAGGSGVSPSAIADTHVFLAETFELNVTDGPGYDKLITL
jgi:NAD(P)-dependent dehydrogenase (short-subunit alcohol dehydrogenase family)